MTADNETHGGEPRLALTITRTFDAPRALVYAAWTDPNRMAQWWGPHAFTNPVCEFEAREGGKLRIDMRAPDGSVNHVSGVFHELVEPERIVLTTMLLGEGGETLAEVLSTVTLEEQDGKTRLTLDTRLLKLAAGMEDALSSMESSWNQSLDRLEELVVVPADAVVLTRVFDAPRDVVFRAWTKAEHLAHWWGPKGFTTPFCTVDLRPGGEFRYCMRSPEGQEFWGKGVYREIVEPERLVYSDSFTDEQGNVVDATHYGMSGELPTESLVTVTFAEDGGVTKVTLRHQVPAAVPQRSGMQQGWSEMLARLAEEVTRG